MNHWPTIQSCTGALRALLAFRAAASASLVRHDRAAPVDADADADADADTIPTCGWFDSSHALVQGLTVCELDTPESLAAAVPLAHWLEWQQAGVASVA